MTSKMDIALEVIKDKQIIRPRDLDAYGIPRRYLLRLHEKGYVRRIERGLYEYVQRSATANATIAEVCKKVPDGIICLLTALQIHDITTQSPHKVWMALDNSARVPKVEKLPVHIVYMSGEALRSGVTTMEFENVRVRVYNPAKTVADCFKFRNKVGLDVAIEALRDVRRHKLATSDELWRFAKICRVSKIMRPYMEAVS